MNRDHDTDRADRARLAELLDLQEGRGPVPVLDEAAIAALLASRPRVAVIGASDRPGRPSRGVLADLLQAGVDAVPITPRYPIVGGVTAYPDLVTATTATGPFSIVDVFRRAEKCPAHAEEAVAAGAAVLWLQLGIVSWEAARIAHAGGLGVVMDRCLSVELHRLRGRDGRG
jgi:predicted CoA-binding protein